MNDSFFAPRKSAVILDPAITTRNAGDEVISQACRRWIRTALPDHFLTTAPTHERMGIRSHRLIRQSEYAIVGGSNILTSRLLMDRGWRVGLRDLPFVNGLILMAAGWRNYEKAPDFATRAMLRRLLHPEAVHSVRDTHTKDMLEKIGITNVVMTGCATMWQLTPDHVATIRKPKGRIVVTTLSMRKPSPQDAVLLETLAEHYDEVWIWPQGIDDRDYANELAPGKYRLLAGTLEAFDEALLSGEDVDYIGVRLHAGIRALQHARRAYIIGIDNRALEIQKDTALPVIARDITSADLGALLEADYAPQITLPDAAISAWIAQFRS